MCCSDTICKEVQEQYHCKKAVALNNPFDLAEVEMLSVKEEAELPWNDGRILISMGREDPVKDSGICLRALHLCMRNCRIRS